MKKQSVFSQIIFLIILAMVCLMLTVGVTLLVGIQSETMFDWKNINLANMIPVLLACVFISCVVMGIAALFVARTAFFKVKDYVEKSNNNKGDEKK